MKSKLKTIQHTSLGTPTYSVEIQYYEGRTQRYVVSTNNIEELRRNTMGGIDADNIKRLIIKPMMITVKDEEDV